jgi:hypothetical protein
MMMLTATALSAAFERNLRITRMQTDGLSQADSLVQLPFRANCMNWVVGHLVTNRMTVLRLLGNPAAEQARLARYERESEPIQGPEPGLLELGELLDLLDALQARIASRLAELSPEDLGKPLAFLGERVQPLADWLFFFYFHDCYHTGQTEILRQASGMDDKII